MHLIYQSHLALISFAYICTVHGGLPRISRKKFGLEKSEIDSAIGEILTISTIVNPVMKFKIADDDPEDNIILECAVEGKADLIISGDRHLIDLKTFQNIPIVKTKEALKRFARDR